MQRSRSSADALRAEKLTHVRVRHAESCLGTKERRGAASLDYVLILGVVLPMVGFVMPACRVAIQAAFAWFCRITASPF